MMQASALGLGSFAQVERTINQSMFMDPLWPVQCEIHVQPISLFDVSADAAPVEESESQPKRNPRPLHWIKMPSTHVWLPVLVLLSPFSIPSPCQSLVCRIITAENQPLETWITMSRKVRQRRLALQMRRTSHSRRSLKRMSTYFKNNVW